MPSLESVLRTAVHSALKYTKEVVPQKAADLHHWLNRQISINENVTQQHLDKACERNTTSSSVLSAGNTTVTPTISEEQQQAQKSFNTLMQHMLKGKVESATRELLRLNEKMEAWSQQRTDKKLDASADGKGKMIELLCKNYESHCRNKEQVRNALRQSGKMYDMLGSFVYLCYGQQRGEFISNNFTDRTKRAVVVSTPLYQELFLQFYPENNEGKELAGSLENDTGDKTLKINHDTIRAAYQILKDAPP